jgi:hypothetical protein
LNFGTNPIEKINLLTMFCGELMGATCAFNNRLDRGLLCSWGLWNPPPEYKPVNKTEGHICYDAIKTAGEVIRRVLGNRMMINLVRKFGKRVIFGLPY